VLGKAVVGKFREAKERVIDLSAEDPECVERFARYLYVFNYEPSEIDSLAMQVKMAIFADKYDIRGLSDLAFIHFKRGARRSDCSTEHLASAAVLAYEVDGPTASFRPVIIQALIETCEGEEGAFTMPDGLQGFLSIHHQLAIDFAMALQRGPNQSSGPEKTSPQAYRFTCMDCDEDVVVSIPKRGPNKMYYCPSCQGGYFGSTWHEQGDPEPL